MSNEPQRGGALARTPTPIDALVRAAQRGDTMAMCELLDRGYASAKGNP